MLKKLIWSVLWRPTRTSTTKTQKRCPFHHRGLVCKIIKSRDTWTNRHIWPWSTKWSRAKANRVLPREWTGHSKHPLPMTQEKTQHMDISRCQYWNQIDYILCSKDGVIYSKQKQDQELTGSDHELIAKFRLKLKKVGKTTRPFRYDLNQIPCNCTVEVTNQFKGLDLIDRMPEELWMELHNIVQEAMIMTSPRRKKKKMQKGKVVVWGGLAKSWRKKRSKRQRRKGKIYPFECRVLKNTKER